MNTKQPLSMQVRPIGVIHSAFKEAKGAPIQPVFSKGGEGKVEVFEQYVEALADLEGFERIWLLYWFDRASDFKTIVKPFMDDKPHGLFATRAPSRPNPIGFSSVKLLSIDGNTLHVGEIDILDNTPLLDIKPYARKFDCYDVKRNGWLDTTNKKTAESDTRFYTDQEEGI